ncbi:hypothetical protein [Azospirillum palustre]
MVAASTRGGGSSGKRLAKVRHGQVGLRHWYYSRDHPPRRLLKVSSYRREAGMTTAMEAARWSCDLDALAVRIGPRFCRPEAHERARR